MSIMAMQTLAEMFLALGQYSKGQAFCALLHVRSKWKCLACERYCLRKVKAGIWEYCFSFFCHSCLSSSPLHGVPYILVLART
jgi:hypothetical protein